MIALGIDIGGTFTDIVVYDAETGTHASRKELTTHDDPARGVIAGLLDLLARDGVDPARIGRVVHATTLFTNALIERKGARTGLLTTEGFRDVLEIGRERKYELYDLFIEMPAPLVPRDLRAEVPERMAPDGTVTRPLEPVALERAAEALVRAGAESLAIVFLHSYANPAHERAALERLAARHPGVFLSASCEVAPEIREYERTSTTVANAYVKPLAHRYLDHLARQVGELRVGAPLLLMLSSGGLTHVAEARRTPVQLLESGPAAGALAAAWFGGLSGETRLLAFDMGGTTAKLSLIEDGEPQVAYRFEAARQKRFIEGSGLPLLISTLDLIEVGAGGGSVAHMDELGLLKVGPHSAGSEPGPACYGRGGTEPTVTDADLLLGYLDPAFFVGGAMAIDRAAAERALAPLAAAAGLSPVEAAWGVHDVVNENMASAARVHVAERGQDPRGYALLATGGAGPVHAWSVARKLGLRRILCPPSAGVASALGLLMAPARVDRVATVAARLDALDWPALEATFARLEADAREVIAATGLAPDSARVQRLADLRYVGQAFELVTVLPPGPYAAASAAAVQAAFEADYLRTFARLPPGVAVEIVNARVSLRAAVPGSAARLGGEAAGSAAKGGAATDGAAKAGAAKDSAATSGAATDSAAALKGRRPAWFPHERPEAGAPRGAFHETPVYDRYRLTPGMALAGGELHGPAIVEERESTLVVGPGGRFHVDAAGNLLVTLPE